MWVRWFPTARSIDEEFEVGLAALRADAAAAPFAVGYSAVDVLVFTSSECASYELLPAGVG